MYPTPPSCASVSYKISCTVRFMTLGSFRVCSLWVMGRCCASVGGFASRKSIPSGKITAKNSGEMVRTSIGSRES